MKKTNGGFQVIKGFNVIKNIIFLYSHKVSKIDSNEVNEDYEFINKNTKDTKFSTKSNSHFLVPSIYGKPDDIEKIKLDSNSRYTYYYDNPNKKLIISIGVYEKKNNNIIFKDLDLNHQFKADIINDNSLLIYSMPGIFYPQVFKLDNSK